MADPETSPEKSTDKPETAKPEIPLPKVEPKQKDDDDFVNDLTVKMKKMSLDKDYPSNASLELFVRLCTTRMFAAETKEEYVGRAKIRMQQIAEMDKTEFEKLKKTKQFPLLGRFGDLRMGSEIDRVLLFDFSLNLIRSEKITDFETFIDKLGTKGCELLGKQAPSGGPTSSKWTPQKLIEYANLAKLPDPSTSAGAIDNVDRAKLIHNSYVDKTPIELAKITANPKLLEAIKIGNSHVKKAIDRQWADKFLHEFAKNYPGKVNELYAAIGSISTDGTSAATVMTQMPLGLDKYIAKS